MLSFLAGVASVAATVFKLINGVMQAARDRLLREAGRNEQKVADLEDDRQKASEARQIDEDVDRMSDSAVTDGLRKYARKADC